MAARFWVGGTGTWDNATTTHWSTSTGGSGGASVPGSSDDVTFDGSSGGGTVTMNYSPSVISITMGAFTGTLADGGNNPTVQTFSGTGTGTRVVTWSGSWTFTGSSGTIFDWTTNTNSTFNLSGSTLTFTGSSVTYTCAKTVANVVFTGSSTNASPHLSSATLVCTNLTMTAPASSAGGLIVLQLTTSTITGTFTATGAARNDRLWVRSSSLNTQRTITVTTGVSFTNVDFQGIKSAGAAGTWTGTSIGDAGNNSGITATSPVSRYWVAGTGSVSDSTNHWASASNGSPAVGNYPLPQDTMVFDASSFSGAGQTVTADAMKIAAIDFTLATNSPTFTLPASGLLFGNITLISAMTFTANAITFEPLGTSIITSAGKTWGSNSLAINTPNTGVGLTLGDAFSLTAQSNNLFTITAGTFTTNNNNLTVGAFVSTGAVTRTINLGSSTVSITRISATNVLSMASTGLTFNAGTSTMQISGTASTGILTIVGAGLTYNNFSFLKPSSAFAYVITGSNTFNVLTITGKNTYQFTNGTTQTVTSFVVNGTSGNLVTLQSDSNGVPWTISSPAGTQLVTYVSLQDSTATGGAVWNANLSTNVSGNTGWNFITAGTITGISSMTGVSSITM